DCPTCGKKIKLPESAIGQSLTCPGCQSRFAVNSGNDKAEAAIQPRPSQLVHRAEVLPAHEPKSICWYCSEEIQPDAMNCNHCGELLDPKLRKRKERASARAGDASRKTNPALSARSVERANRRLCGVRHPLPDGFSLCYCCCSFAGRFVGLGS